MTNCACPWDPGCRRPATVRVRGYDEGKEIDQKMCMHHAVGFIIRVSRHQQELRLVDEVVIEDGDYAAWRATQ